MFRGRFSGRTGPGSTSSLSRTLWFSSASFRLWLFLTFSFGMQIFSSSHLQLWMREEKKKTHSLDSFYHRFTRSWWTLGPTDPKDKGYDGYEIKSKKSFADIIPSVGLSYKIYFSIIPHICILYISPHMALCCWFCTLLCPKPQKLQNWTFLFLLSVSNST